MIEARRFEPTPRDTTLEAVCQLAFDRVFETPERFALSNYTDGLGLAHERVTYTNPNGHDAPTKIWIARPSVETAELLKPAEGTIDEKPRADISVHAPRGFLFDLANGEKYFADKGYFRAIILGDGAYLDVLSMAFSTPPDNPNIQTVQTVGSMLRPLPTRTDWIIQDIIKPV